MFNDFDVFSQKFENSSLESDDTEKISEKFNSYHSKFENSYSNIKHNLSNIQDNIINYKSEINKLEDFLIIINEHEKNYKEIQNSFNELIKYLKKSIEMETTINSLSSNQQIINMSEYVNLYKQFKKIQNYFNNKKFLDKDDFIKNLNKLMYNAFKVYHDAFYVILKRFEQLNNKDLKNLNDENEKLNCLNKIRKLSNVLQDSEINFDFTKNLIKDHSNKICNKIEEIKLNNNNDNKNIKKNNNFYIKKSGFMFLILKECEKLFENEKKFINEILSECEEKVRNKTLNKILLNPCELIINYLENLLNFVEKNDDFNTNLNEFIHILDIIEIWLESTFNNFKENIRISNEEEFNEINNIIVKLGEFCIKFIKKFFEKIDKLNNDKIENENVLNITNDTIFFISNLILYPTAYKFLTRKIKDEITPNNFIKLLLEKIELKSDLLLKKYPPLKFILLINNIFFIISKIENKTIENFFNKKFIQMLYKRIENNIEKYLKSSWNKIDEITFDDKEIIVYENDKKTLKTTSKELIKKKFSVFNETMKLNQKFQQHIQIIDRKIEQKIIEKNIEYVCERYQKFYDKYSQFDFTKFRNKYLIYNDASEVEQDLRLYFLPDGDNNNNNKNNIKLD